jgi:hypothetical protein
LRDDLTVAGCPTTFEAPNGSRHALTFQALRRSCATYLAAADVTGEVIGQILGHAGKSVAMKHYTAKDVARLARAIERIDLEEEPGMFDGGLGAPRATIVYGDDGLPTVPAWGDCPTTFAPPWDFHTWATVGIARFITEIEEAPPARVERTTNGLGNRCSIH